MKRSIVTATLAALLACAAANTQAHEPTTGPNLRVALNIEAQPVREALQAFGEQTGLQVLFRSEGVRVAGVKAAPVSGKMEAGEALSRMLVETGLKYEFVNAKTVRVAATEENANGAEASARPLVGAQAQSVSLLPGERNDRSIRTAAAVSPSESTGSSSGNSSALEEIVVTAQKRPERLQNVPISISVLTGEDLDRSTVEGITEALKRVPGVGAFPFSQAGGTFVTVRGVTAGGPLFAGASPVSYYLDSVPFGLVQSAFAPDANAYDLERVEVLRGPQGTLYGASAQAGVVRVLTRDADLEHFDVKGRVSTSSTETGGWNYRGDAAINVPIVTDKLAARAVVGYEDLSGWIDSRFTDNSNDAQLLNARLKVNAQPSEALSIGAFAWLARDDYGGPTASDAEARRRAAIDESIAIDYNVYGLKISYNFPGFSLTSSSGYMDYSSGGFLDLVELGSPLPFFTGFDANVFSQEVILNSTHEGPWRWTAGAIYRDGKDSAYQTVPAWNYVLDWTNTSRSAAIFGELSRRFAGNELEWTLGGRYFEDDVVTQEDAAVPPVNPPNYYRAQASFHSATPRAVLTWFPSNDVTVYGSYSEGFRSGTPQPYYVTGGVGGLPAVRPDKLHNYEVGTKGSLWDGRVEFDTALYYMRWTDVQQQLVIPYGPTPDAGVLAIINGESASGVGFDFGVTLRPATRWELGLNFSWNDLTMDADILSGGVLLFAKGDRPNFSPEYTVGASADYSFPLGGGFDGRLSASANYTSKQGFRTIYPGVLSLGFGDAMLIARTSFSIRGRNPWELTVFADNINNERGTVVGDPFTGPDADLRVRPRTIGVQLDYHY